MVSHILLAVSPQKGRGDEKIKEEKIKNERNKTGKKAKKEG
jgi:hypothetical protein